MVLQGLPTLALSQLHNTRSPERRYHLFVRLWLSLIEPTSVQPHQSAQACARHYLPHLPLLCLPAANRSLAVRGSHVSRELLRHITPPRSVSLRRIRLPFRFQGAEIPKRLPYQQ